MPIRPLVQAALAGAGPSSAGGGEVAAPPQPQLARRRKPRTSKNPKNSIAPSVFRPHVLARDRITAWKSPHMLTARKALLNKIPPSHADRLEEVFTSAVVTRTRENWGAGDRMWLRDLWYPQGLAELDQCVVIQSLVVTVTGKVKLGNRRGDSHALTIQWVRVGDPLLYIRIMMHCLAAMHRI
jgi:hypothetical protein